MLIPDIIHYICSTTGLSSKDLGSFSLACREYNALARPYLFSHVAIVAKNKDWDRLNSLLTDLNADLEIARHFKSVRIELSRVSETFGKIGSSPPDETANLLCSVLQATSCLERLFVIFPYRCTVHFTNMLRHLKLPTVQTLVIGPTYEILISCCPNIQTLSMPSVSTDYNEEDYYPFILSAAGLPYLKAFEMNGVWSLNLFTLIADNLQGLTELKMSGPCEVDIKTLAPLLASIKSLRVLGLPDGVGPEVPFFLLNRAWRPAKRSEKEKVERILNESNKHIVDALLDSCPWVETVWVKIDRKVVEYGKPVAPVTGLAERKFYVPSMNIWA